MSRTKIAERDASSLAGIAADQIDASDDQLLRLSELSDQISSKIRDLLVKRNFKQKSAAPSEVENDYANDLSFATWLKKTYETRQNRSLYLGSADIFSEPAWDIILDIAYNQLHSKHVSVKAACIASHVPASTALRYLSKMEQDGILVRVKDKADRRREFVMLTPEFMVKLHRFVASTR